jgi:hypothetical protein
MRSHSLPNARASSRPPRLGRFISAA